MNNAQILNRKYVSIAWGLLFLWWGLRWWLLAALPNGTGLLGTGLILLGLNVARSMKGIPARNSTTYLGMLALALGGCLYLATVVLNVPVEIPLFDGTLIVWGVILVIRAWRGQQRAAQV